MGAKIIDGSGGAAVACLGHGNRRIAEAIGRQAATMAYAHTGTFSSQPAEDLAHIVLDGEPGGLTHAYFCSSGSEGTEAALKLARQYFVELGQTRRTHVIARRQSYHGNTLGALAAGGNMMRRAIYEPILTPEFSHVSPCFAYRFKHDDETDAQYVDRLADELEARFMMLGGETVMAFIAEPVVGATTGCVTAVPGLFPTRAGDLRPPRRAADPGRGDVRHGPHRHDACLGAGRRHARTCRSSPRGWAAATSRSAAC